jgi:hypothetical protein
MQIMCRTKLTPGHVALALQVAVEVVVARLPEDQGRVP